MTIADLKTEEKAIVVGCSVKRLCDLGLSTGTEVRMVKPGSPCIVEIFGKSISVGVSYQKEILIQGGEKWRR